MKYCPNCQKYTEEELSFCEDCGAPLLERSAAEPARVPEEVEADRAPSESDTLDAGRDLPRRGKKPLGFGRRLLAFVLSLLLFALLLLPVSGLMLRFATTETGLKKLLGELDLAALRVDPGFEDVDERLSLSVLLAEDLTARGMEIGDKTVGRALRSVAVRDYLAGEFAAFCGDLYRGKSEYQFEEKKLRELLMDERLVQFLKGEGFLMDEQRAETIAAMVNGYGLGNELQRDAVKAENRTLYRVVHYGLNYVALGLLLALALLFVKWIGGVNRWYALANLRCFGGVLLADGGVLTLAALAVRLLPDPGRALPPAGELAAQFASAALWTQLPVPLAIAGAGLLLLLVGRLVRRSQRRKERA